MLILYSSCLQDDPLLKLANEREDHSPTNVYSNMCVLFSYYELTEKVAITDDPYISDLSIMLKAHAVDSCKWVCHMLAVLLK